MKHINFLILSALTFIVFSVSADDKANVSNTANEIKGEATIIVDNKTYNLPLKKCYSATNLEDGKSLEAFIISTHQSRKSKGSEPRFTAIGSKTEKTGYSLQIDGGFSKGGTRYQGKMPFDSFKDNKLVFEGKAKSIMKENKKSVKGLVSISIMVTCHD